MAQDLSQILQELNSVYDPQRAVQNQQIASLDPAMAGEETGLKSQATSAFQNITDQANRRGLFYSGIPINEQAKYTSDTFLPAVANLHSKYATQRFGLQDALAKITSDQYSKAYDVRQNQVAAEEKAREFDRQLAATEAASIRTSKATAAATPSFDFGLGADTTATPATGAMGLTFRVPGDPSKGFAFSDSAGNPANALQYSQAHNIPFYTLLQQMAAAGDPGAAAGLKFIGNDGNADPRKVTSPQLANLYFSLTGRRVPVASQPIKNVLGQPAAAKPFPGPASNPFGV